MFKNPFRDESHDEYAARTLEQAKLDLLKALETVEFYEAVVSYRRKQIARLEGTEYAKRNKINNPDMVIDSRNAEPGLA